MPWLAAAIVPAITRMCKQNMHASAFTLEHEIQLATHKAGEYANDKEEVTGFLFIRLRRNGSGGEGHWEMVVLVTAQMAGASSREGMGLQGGDGAPGRRGTPGASSREARSSREAMGLQRGA